MGSCQECSSDPKQHDGFEVTQNQHVTSWLAQGQLAKQRPSGRCSGSKDRHGVYSFLFLAIPLIGLRCFSLIVAWFLPMK